MFQTKKEDFAAGKLQDGLDLMGAMVGASLTSESHNEFPRSEHDQPSSTKPVLSDAEIIGNSFLLILAGHETAANSIHFSLVYLAMRPSSQRRLQADLDSIFGSRPVSEWEYEHDINQLFSGVGGAILAEELRLIPPVINIPKSTAEKSPPVPLTINGKTYHVPPNTFIKVSATGVHRNPAFWPAGPPTNPASPVHPTSNTDNDLEEFKPER
jgi:cytochrome P450